MYINPFWAGVLATILTELGLVIVFIFMNVRVARIEEEDYEQSKDNNNKGNE